MTALVSVLAGPLAAPGSATKGAGYGAVVQQPAGQHGVVAHANDAAESRKPRTFVMGRSVGSPTDGHLLSASHLDDGPHLRVVPSYAQGDVRWGLGPLVGMIDRSARAVRKQFPDAVLSIGHISRAGGGELDRHVSHESGRDADIGFYIKNQTGHPLMGDHFVAFRGDGTAPSWPGALFDDARNWALVSTMVNDGAPHITHIFVATPLRARLLAYAERSGASPATRSRAAELMAQPRGCLPHDDHFHVRIACPAGMTGCVETPTAPHHVFARVPTPHGRTHTGIGHARSGTTKPATPGSAGSKPVPTAPTAVPKACPLPLSSEGHGAEPTTPDSVNPADRAQPDAPPAALSVPIDDVDGVLSTP